MYKEDIDEIKDQLYKIAEELEIPTSFVTDIIEYPYNNDEYICIEDTIQRYMLSHKNGTYYILYARLQLTLKIYLCLKCKVSCTFTAEMYLRREKIETPHTP